VPRLRLRDLLRIAWRSSLLQATWNYERQQGLGWAYAFQPALERVQPDPAARAMRLAEHTAFFNTQPTLASLALGATAALEQQRAETGVPTADSIERVKSVLGSSLAAVGDRLFWFTLRPFAACFGILLALTGTWQGAAGMWLCYNLIHQGIRFFGVPWGYIQGPQRVAEELRGGLRWLAYALGLAGTALVGILSAQLLAGGGEARSMTFQLMLAAGMFFGLLTARRARPSPASWALVIAALSLFMVSRT
jgi:mannose/fructose/N-acetylgalactosamine-specific phosphotransferase system component IID